MNEYNSLLDEMGISPGFRSKTLHWRGSVD